MSKDGINLAFSRAFETMDSRGWEKIYVLVDLHDTVLKGDYNSVDDRSIAYLNNAILALKIMTDSEEICMILWSSTPPEDIQIYTKDLENHGIHFNFINENPEVTDSAYSDYSKKLYFNVIIDDKAGFNGDVDWHTVYTVLTERQLSKDLHL